MEFSKEAGELAAKVTVETERERGVCKFFNNTYGFIERRDGKPDVFVHFTAILGDASFKTLSPDEPVEFEVVDGLKGPMAVRVRSLG